MAKNTKIFTYLQNFISQEEINGILVEFGFEDTARKCDVPTLLNYLIGVATSVSYTHLTLPTMAVV